MGYLHSFLRRPWVLSRALACGARRGAARTPRYKFGSRAGSVARALGVQSRESWQIITGLLSAELEPSKTMETPHASCFAPLLHKLSTWWQPRYKSSRPSNLCGPQLRYAYVDIAYSCLLCAVILRVRVCRRVRVCVSVCWNAGTPHFCFLFFCSTCCCCCCCCCRRIMSVSHRPSSSLLCGSHGTTVTQQLCVGHYLLCVLTKI